MIWALAVLGLFLILFGISQITNNSNDSNRNAGSMGGQPENQQQADQEVSVMTLIRNNGCTSCHGPDLRGSNLAPALIGISKYWERDKLISYLRNPSSFMDSDRFKSYRQKYSSVVMPPFNNLDIKDLGRIADYLLRL